MRYSTQSSQTRPRRFVGSCMRPTFWAETDNLPNVIYISTGRILMVFQGTINLLHLLGKTKWVLHDKAHSIAIRQQVRRNLLSESDKIGTPKLGIAVSWSTQVYNCEYIPSPFNLADCPSRQLATQLEWQIAPIFRLLDWSEIAW
jgi:hypothetical protein